MMAVTVKVNREPAKGGRPAKIDDEMKNKIVVLYNSGMNGKDIAEAVKVSRASVYRILKERR